MENVTISLERYSSLIQKEIYLELINENILNAIKNSTLSYNKKDLNLKDEDITRILITFYKNEYNNKLKELERKENE